MFSMLSRLRLSRAREAAYKAVAVKYLEKRREERDVDLEAGNRRNIGAGGSTRVVAEVRK